MRRIAEDASPIIALLLGILLIWSLARVSDYLRPAPKGLYGSIQ